MESFNRIIGEIKLISTNRSVENLSELEKDLIKEKLRKLYDLLTFSEVTPQQPITEKKESAEILTSEFISSTSIEEKIQQSETDISEIISDEIISDDISGPSEGHEDESKPEPNLFSSANPTKEVQKTIAEDISESIQKESVADKIQKTTKVDCLKVAIGINEKFFFINELFDGNLNDYNKTIEELDRLETFESAMEFIDGLAEENKWPDEGEAINQLIQFIERKLK